MTARVLAGFVALAALGCGPSVDARFAAAETRANETARTGRHADAAELWVAAARVAGTTTDREEAEYRAAASFARAGRTTQALALYERLASGQGERSARASFECARLVAETDPARGDTLLLAAIRSHPSSGVAPRAVREHLVRIEHETGMRAARDEATRLQRELAGTELDETLRYERARLLEREGSLSAARDAYLETATRHPYPDGALWDDALAHAAALEERLGRPRGAIALYERMLAEREPSSGVGSYERARYAEARFRVAELFRDRLGDPTRAGREFRRVFDEHPTSLLRDDALFQEALLARANGGEGAACEALELLVRELPDSRYAACAPRLCPGVPAPKRRECHVELPELRASEALRPGASHSSSSSSSSSSSP